MPRKKAVPISPSKLELDYKQFGNTLRAMIKARGYTQAVFAEAVGISYSSMMAILKGERHIYVHTYVRMLDVLGIHDDLLTSSSVVIEPKKIISEEE